MNKQGVKTALSVKTMLEEWEMLDDRQRGLTSNYVRVMLEEIINY